MTEGECASARAAKQALEAFRDHRITYFDPNMQGFRVVMRVSAESSKTASYAYGGIHAFLGRYFPGFKVRYRKRNPHARTTVADWHAHIQGMAKTGAAGGADFHTMCQYYMEADGHRGAIGAVFAARDAKFRNFHAHVTALRLTPLFSEYAVCDLVLGYATTIDAIFFDAAAQRVVVVELKTGYDRVFEQPSGEVRAPLDLLFEHASPLNRALAQAYLPAIALRLSCADLVATVEVQVWHVSAERLKVYPLSTECTTRGVAARMHELFLAENAAFADQHPLRKKRRKDEA